MLNLGVLIIIRLLMNDDNFWTRVYEHDYKPLAV